MTVDVEWGRHRNEARPTQTGRCAFCGAALDLIGYHWTCHYCGAEYCHIHMSKHARAHPLPGTVPTRALTTR